MILPGWDCLAVCPLYFDEKLKNRLEPGN